MKIACIILIIVNVSLLIFGLLQQKRIKNLENEATVSKVIIKILAGIVIKLQNGVVVENTSEKK